MSRFWGEIVTPVVGIATCLITVVIGLLVLNVSYNMFNLPFLTLRESQLYAEVRDLRREVGDLRERIAELEGVPEPPDDQATDDLGDRKQMGIPLSPLWLP